MTDIDRAVVVWSGFVGGPGVSIHYALPGGGVADKLTSFFLLIKSYIPTVVDIQVPANGDTIDDATGAITGSWSGGPQSSVDCTGSGAYAAQAGGLIRWGTGGIVAGRRVRGHTFLVPIVGTFFDTAGRLSVGTKNALESAASAFVTSAADHAVVWSRPTPSRAGSSHLITSAFCPLKSATLTSRRD